jgi:hypothetical protein
LQAFEHWFGPYPFMKIVTDWSSLFRYGTQSSVTCNGYKNSYRGRDLSGTGWGLKFDFIIIHESGHEWFAICTYKIIADMWIHEFTQTTLKVYLLNIFYGKEAGYSYVRGDQEKCENDKPIIIVHT